MLVSELLEHLKRMDENSVVKLKIKTKDALGDDFPAYAPIQSIEFDSGRVVLKGEDELVEWD